MPQVFKEFDFMVCFRHLLMKLNTLVLATSTRPKANVALSILGLQDDLEEKLMYLPAGKQPAWSNYDPGASAAMELLGALCSTSNQLAH